MAAGMMNSMLPPFCQICTKSFQSQEMALQHYESPSHLQRLALSRGPQIFTSVAQNLYCDRCDIYVEDDQTMQEHLGSYRHMENMGGGQAAHIGAQKWKLSGQLGAGTGLSPSFQSPSAMAASTRGIYGRAPQHTYDQYAGAMEGNGEFHFDHYNNRGHCNVCGIELTSQVHMEQHITGKSHQKMTTRKRLGAISQPASTVPAPVSAIGFSQPTAQPPPTMEIGHPRPQTTYSAGLHGNNTSFFSDQRTPLVGSNSQTVKMAIPEGQDDVYKTEEINGEIWFKCTVCNIKTNTLAVMHTHLIGAKHLKNVEKQVHLAKCGERGDGMEGLSTMLGSMNITAESDDNFTTEHKDGTLWHVCKLCDIRVNSEDQLLVHKTGAKHLKAAQQGGVDVKGADEGAGGETFLVTSVKPNVEEFEGTIWTKEIIVGQLWYTCIVCKVKMNTLETLKVHMGGTKHMKNMKYFHYTRSNSAKVEKGEGESSATVTEDGGGAARDGGEGERKLGGMEGRGWHTEHNMGTMWYVCDVCNVRMNSEDILKVHQMGSKHMRNEQQWKLTHGIETDTDGPQGQNLLGGENERKTWRKEQGPGGWWYVCEVCDVKMNTYEQLKIHQVGTKHMKNERRFQTLGMLDDVENEKAKLGKKNSEHLNDANEEDEEKSMITDCAMSNGNCSTGCFFHCPVCDVHCSGPVPRDQHLASAQHKKNIVKQGPRNKPRQPQYVERKIPEPDEFCDVCQYSFTGRGALEAHLKTKYHQSQVLKKEKPDSEEKDDTNVHKYINIDEEGLEGKVDVNKLAKTTPRSYQVELFKKAMTKDSLCFLPTGAGKTLVAAMVIRHMLDLNPRRPVIFLVDRILLVTQQSQVLKEELGHMNIKRYDGEGNKFIERTPRIAALCGGKQETDGLPLYQQDIIVTTAAYYLKLLEEEVVRWSSNCLVVIDEAHHCDKEHPFNRLLYEYNAPLNTVLRPKILGLTASPAGKDDVPATEQMLLDLLDNIGDETRLIQVEEEVEVLMEYQSRAEITPMEVSSQWLAEHMCGMVLKVLHELLLWLAEHTTLGQMAGVATLFSGDPRSNDGGLNLDLRKVENIISHLPQIQGVTSTAVALVHVKAIITMLLNVLMMVYTYGLPNAPEGLVYLKDMKDVRQLIQLSFANHLLLRKLKHLAMDYFMIREVLQRSGISVDDQTTHQVAALQIIEELIEKVDWLATAEGNPNNKGDLTMALILVKTRKDAVMMEEIVKSSSAITDKGLSVCRVVGHGEGRAGSGGMNVNQQNHVLAAIKDKQYNIVVATSVAEEGLDLPECEMVLELDPPTSVTALIQIRGRARRKGSRFVLLCSTHSEMNELRQVLRKEQNMEEAVRNVVNIQREIEQRQTK